MKSIKKILLLILALSLSLMLFACGGGSDACTEHTDADGNNKCDACGETITPGGGVEKPVEDLPLVENGQALFQIVVADSALDLDGVISAANSISNTLGRNGITVSRWAYEDDTAAECEVIIGVTSSRDRKSVV